MSRAYGEGRYGEALEVAREAWRRFPEKEGRTAYWVACLLCRVGDPDGALRALQDARARGHWWGEGLLRGDPDLQPLWGNPDFAVLVEGCREAEREARAAARPEVLVLRSKALGPHPLLLAFHGRGGNAEEYAPYFQPATALGWTVALPQGTQLQGDGMFTWDDPAQAEQEAAWAYAHVLRTEAMEPGRVVLAGVSQGGTLAIRLALAGTPIPACGFVTVIPAAADLEEALDAAPEAARRGIRGWTLTGERDLRMEKVRVFHDRLVRSGVSCELEVVPGLGHEVPDDFSRRLVQALKFVARR